MSRYLIAVDLDGTLLRDDKTISERNLRALHAAREAGHEVMIARPVVRNGTRSCITNNSD